MRPIRFILSGGGTRCAYQMSFLEHLTKNKYFKNKFYIDKIYGTSFGAFVGFYILLNKLDIIKEFFSNIDEDSLEPCYQLNLFGLYKVINKIPLVNYLFKFLNNIIWLLVSIKKKGFYKTDYGEKYLNKLNLNNFDYNLLDKFECCVYNITKNKIQFIKGSHPLIKEYIIASSALWLVFPPKIIKQLKSECVCNNKCDCSKVQTKNNEDDATIHQTKNNEDDATIHQDNVKVKSINNGGNINNITNIEIYCDCSNQKHQYNEYIDGGILKQIPIKIDEDDNFDGIYYVLTTKDIYKLDKNFKILNTGNNLFEYLDQIIDSFINYNQYIQINSLNKLHNKQIKIINYKAKTINSLLLEKKVINKYINDGILLANKEIDNILNL